MQLSKRDIRLALISYLALFVPLAAFYFWKGLRIDGDATYYIEYADILLAGLSSGRDVWAVLGEQNPFYLACIGLLAVIKKLGGDYWPQAILLANAFFYALCAPFVYLLHRKCGGRGSVVFALGAALLPLGYPEALFLGNMPLRDVPFTGAAAAATYLLLLLAGIRGKAAAWFLAFLICAALTLVRPNAVIFFASTTALFIWVWQGGQKLNTSRALGILLIQFALGAAAIFAAAHWFHDPHPLPFGKLESILREVKDINQTGAIIIHHQDGYVAPPDGFWGHLRLLWLKFAYYLYYWNPMHSFRHWLYRHLYFGLLFANLGYCFFMFFTSRRKRLAENARKLVFFTLSLILAGAALHTILVLAFEFRYQMILFPGVWALLLVNLDRLWRAKRLGRGADRRAVENNG